MPSKSRSETNWEQELQEGDTFIDRSSGQKVISLKVLRRKAREAGLVESQPFIQHAVGPTGKGLIQCIYQLKFDDGTRWAAAADVSQANCNEAPYCDYPTAMAESRAESRAIKKALGIEILAADEVRGRKESGDHIDSQVLRVIQQLLETKKVAPIVAIQSCLSKDRQDHINSLEDLTVTEGHQIMEWLNGAKGSVKTDSTLDKRNKRKAELENA